MGAGYVKAAFGLWGHLPDRAFRMLTFMAVSVPDRNDPPIYWGGREMSAVGLGRAIPTGTTGTDVKARRAAFESVRAAIAELQAVGAIHRINTPGAGKNAQYQLNLAITPTLHLVQEQPASGGTGSACDEVQGQPADRYRVSLPEVQGGPTPYEEEEEVGLTRRPNLNSSTPAYVAARETRRQKTRAKIDAQVVGR